MVNVLKVMVAELTFCIKREKKLVGNLITFALQDRNLIKPIFNSSNARGGERGWKIGEAFAHNFCLAGQEVVGCCLKLIEAQHEGCIKYIFY